MKSDRQGSGLHLAGDKGVKKRLGIREVWGKAGSGLGRTRNAKAVTSVARRRKRVPTQGKCLWVRDSGSGLSFIQPMPLGWLPHRESQGRRPGTVVHSCSPSCSGGRSRMQKQDRSSKDRLGHLDPV